MEPPCHIKGVLKRISHVYQAKVYLVLVADGTSEDCSYVIPVQFDMPEYVHHIGDNLSLGKTYMIFHASPCLLKFSEKMGMVAFRTTQRTTIQKVVSKKDIEDVWQPFVDIDRVSSRLLNYAESRRFSCYKGTVSEVLSEECGFYVLDQDVTLVTLPSACDFHLPRLAIGDRVIISDCHRVDSSVRVQLVTCFASRVQLINKQKTTPHQTHSSRWIRSLHCGSLYFCRWLRRTLQTFTGRFVRSYLKPEDLVSYDKDANGKRTRSLIFNLLRRNAPWLRDKASRVPEFEFFSQPHQCTALEAEDPRLASLEWPNVETMCRVVKFKGIPFSVAPTWRTAVIPVGELPFQVIGCLGQSTDGTLHLCDRSGHIPLRSSVPAKSLPLGHIVAVSPRARFILESLSTMQHHSNQERHTIIYIEAHSFIPLLKAIPPTCPHFTPPPHRSGRWQAFRVTSASLPHTLGGKHAFHVTCAFPRDQQQRVLLFPNLRWLPILKPGGEFRIQLPPNTSRTSPRIPIPPDTSLRMVPSQEAAKMDFSAALAASSEDVRTLTGVVMDKFYQSARSAQAGLSPGPDMWSPCLKVESPGTGLQLTVYLNSLTASVPLLGLLPGALIRLERMRYASPGAKNPYAMSVNNTVLDLADRGQAVYAYKATKQGWPIQGGPLNGISYGMPLRRRCGFVSSIDSLRIWPDCRVCCREIGQHGADSAHVPVPTAFLRISVLCNANEEVTVICWDDQVQKVLDVPDRLWNLLLDRVAKSVQCMEYSIRGVREVTDTSGRQVVQWGWTPLEKCLASWCKSPSLLRCMSFTAREMRFPDKPAAMTRNVPATEERETDIKRRFHATAFEELDLLTVLRLRDASRARVEKLERSKAHHLRRFLRREAVAPRITWA